MRIKLSILTGVVGFTVAGIAMAGPGKAFFSAITNPNATISELVSTSLWSKSSTADSTPETANATSKHLVITVPNGQILPDTTTSQLRNKPSYIPNTNVSVADNTINADQTIGNFGYAGNNANSSSNADNNSFAGGVGGGANWGPVANSGNSGNGGLAANTFLLSNWTLSNNGTLTFNGGVGINNIVPSKWTLSSSGTLTFSAAAASIPAVPEPGEWLLMLFGFGLIGFVANCRKPKACV